MGNREATIVLYYTGHRAIGPKDLWLQTAGQEEVGDGQGVSVSDLIIHVRRHPDGARAFEGELVVIVDACYSGQGTVSQGLTLGDFGSPTTILTSSTEIQESYAFNQPGKPQMSAFTHALLEGLGPHWGDSDGDHDGLLRWEELKVYAAARLRRWHEDGALAQLMNPKLVSSFTEGFLAYRRDQVHTWQSRYRDVFTTQTISARLAIPLGAVDPNSSAIRPVPPEVQALAGQFEPASDDYHAQAVKAMGEEDWNRARTLFSKATKQSQARQTAAAAVQQHEQHIQGKIELDYARMEAYAGNFQQSFQIYKSLVKLIPSPSADLLMEVGNASMRAGNYNLAEDYLLQAAHRRIQDGGNISQVDSRISHNLALVYFAQDRLVDSESLYKKAIILGERALGFEHEDVATSLDGLAVLYSLQKRLDEAEPLWQRAVAILRKSLGPDNPHLGEVLNNQATLYEEKKDYKSAEALYVEALRITEIHLGSCHHKVAIILGNFGEIYEAQGKFDKAEPLYQRALSILSMGSNPIHFVASKIFAYYQRMLRSSGQPSKPEDVIHKLKLSKGRFINPIDCVNYNTSILQ